MNNELFNINKFEIYTFKFYKCLCLLMKLIRYMINQIKNRKIMKFVQYFIVLIAMTICVQIRKKKRNEVKILTQKYLFFEKKDLNKDIKVIDLDSIHKSDDVLINFINKNNKIREKYGLIKENTNSSFFKIMRAYMLNANKY